MGFRDRRWLWRACAALALVLAVGVFAAQRERAASEQSSSCARFEAQASLRADTVTGSGSRTVVIGDSWSAGLAPGDIGHTWTEHLPGRVNVHAFAGSGFSRTASGCGPAFSYAMRAETVRFQGAALVVLEGGLNDFDRSEGEIRAGFDAVVDVITASDIPLDRVQVVGPARAPSRAGDAIRVDRILARAAAERGVGYVSVIDLQLEYLEDMLHLTRAGHAEFGRAVSERLKNS